jgi:hypothetical protein
MNDTLHNLACWADRVDRIAIAMVLGAVRSASQILAEVVAVRHGHEGGQLRTRDGRIHTAAS